MKDCTNVYDFFTKSKHKDGVGVPSIALTTKELFNYITVCTHV